MTQIMPLRRRHVLAGIAAMAALPAPAQAQGFLDAAALGLVGDSDLDQSAALQRAMEIAVGAGQILRLPRGALRASGLAFPNTLVMEGVPGSTQLSPFDGGTVGDLRERSRIVIRDITFSGGMPASANPTTALLNVEQSNGITLERCVFRNAPISAITIYDAAVTISDCSFGGIGDAAIHAMDSRGLMISGNRIDGCGNAGIRIWRSENGSDGSIVTGNRISNIAWRDGGNGQNGNGVNVFKADEVIVSDNHISDCAFTAVRLNSTNNTQVSGNICLRSGEVAIFSEFAFSGSIIANNIIDGAATGISVTNLDSGGQLAVVSGNIVRNITPTSLVNPDTVPIGIFAEAETAITANTVQNVPGIAIAAGYGTYLRNVMISANVVSASNVGIGISVVDGAGAAHVANNLIREPRDYAVVGLAWLDVIEPDLLANVGKYPNITVN